MVWALFLIPVAGGAQIIVNFDAREENPAQKLGEEMLSFGPARRLAGDQAAEHLGLIPGMQSQWASAAELGYGRVMAGWDLYNGWKLVKEHPNGPAVYTMPLTGWSVLNGLRGKTTGWAGELGLYAIGADAMREMGEDARAMVLQQRAASLIRFGDRITPPIPTRYDQVIDQHQGLINVEGEKFRYYATWQHRDDLPRGGVAVDSLAVGTFHDLRRYDGALVTGAVRTSERQETHGATWWNLFQPTESSTTRITAEHYTVVKRGGLILGPDEEQGRSRPEPKPPGPTTPAPGGVSLQMAAEEPQQYTANPALADLKQQILKAKKAAQADEAKTPK